jgi:hypothetical protein
MVDLAGNLKIAVAEDVLRAGEWMHVAGVTGRRGMKLYINGELVAENPYTGSLQSLGGNNMGRIGQTVGEVRTTPVRWRTAEVACGRPRVRLTDSR